MSSSFKGILSIIVGVLFITPWFWTGLLGLNHLSYIVIFAVGIIASATAIFLGFSARKNGSGILGIVGMTIGIIAVVTYIANLIKYIGR